MSDTEVDGGSLDLNRKWQKKVKQKLEELKEEEKDRQEGEVGQVINWKIADI